jgi:hypothetical protein
MIKENLDQREGQPKPNSAGTTGGGAVLDETPDSPLRVAYSRAELADKLKDWMIELWENSPKNLDSEQRDQWHRDNGLIYHFICDHFPLENAERIHGGDETPNPNKTLPAVG